MSKKNRVLTWISIAYIVIAITCIPLYNFIGATVDENGVLHETFYLVPLGIVTFLAGLIIGIIALFSRIKEKRQIENE
jgi:hypothetical protein